MENPSTISNTTKLPQSPRIPMDFLSRSWSASAIIEQTIESPRKPPPQHKTPTPTPTAALPKERSEFEEQNSQRVLDRIFSHLHLQHQHQHQHQQDHLIVSPLNSGRPSLSSEPSNFNYSNGGNNGSVGNVGNGGGMESSRSGSGSLTANSDSPPISPSKDFQDVLKFLQSNNTTTTHPQYNGCRSTAVTPSGGGGGGGGGKTVGRWLKDRREKKKEETRAHTAQLHAAISVAGVAAAVAAIAAASSGGQGQSAGEKRAKADTAVASAATLVAAQCVEAAEAMGAERDHLASVISSAVNVRSYDDIVTLTAAAATALRGAATLKARALKDVWNAVAAETPLQRAMPPRNNPTSKYYPEELDGYTPEFLATGCEILKRTRKGDLHWKIISIYIHRSGQVMLKMKSRHVAGTITKKKKNVVVEVYKHMAPWPGRKHVLEGREQRCYFGLRTQIRGVVEFECRNHKEHDLWTQGVVNLLATVAERKCRRYTYT